MGGGLAGRVREEEEEEADLEGGAKYAELDEGHGELSGGGGGGDEGRGAEDAVVAGRTGSQADADAFALQNARGAALLMSSLSRRASSLSRSISSPSVPHCIRTTAPYPPSDFMAAAAAPDDEERARGRTGDEGLGRWRSM